jgi:ribosome biogenesis GTPase A
MASKAKRTTMGKLNREAKVRYKRAEKEARKQARKQAAVADSVLQATDAREPTGALADEQQPG